MIIREKRNLAPTRSHCQLLKQKTEKQSSKAEVRVYPYIPWDKPPGRLICPERKKARGEIPLHMSLLDVPLQPAGNFIVLSPQKKKIKSVKTENTVYWKQPPT